jgi:tRNA threonylcarbamoyladenosine biosynthesis protein TsaE
MRVVASLERLGDVVDAIDACVGQEKCVMLFLKGDLASGKTTLTQAVTKAKGIESEVTSPTFSLQQCYEGENGNRLYHYDLYRLDEEQFMQMGLLEEFQKEGWHFIEWGSERLANFLASVGYRVVHIHITQDPQGRCYEIEA